MIDYRHPVLAAARCYNAAVAEAVMTGYYIYNQFICGYILTIRTRRTAALTRSTCNHQVNHHVYSTIVPSVLALDGPALLFSSLTTRSAVHADTICDPAIRRHHPTQRAVLSQICCFWEHKVVLFQIMLDDAEPRDAGTT